MLWSAVSLLTGHHFSGSPAMMLTAVCRVLTFTWVMSSGSGNCSRTSRAACTTVCEYWPRGKRLMLHSPILKGCPGPPNVSSSNGWRVTALK